MLWQRLLPLNFIWAVCESPAHFFLIIRDQKNFVDYIFTVHAAE